MPPVAQEKLGKFGKLIRIATTGITYPAISGHPDIFFCSTPGGLVIAPDVFEHYQHTFKNAATPLIKGNSKVGKKYPQSATYNAVISDNLLIHNTRLSDERIKQYASETTIYHVNQGYARCNLLPLGNRLFITSDRGIDKSLKSHGIECHFFSPSEIRLEGFAHGFLGGACGVNADKLFVCGSLKYHPWEDDLRTISCRAGLEVVELIDAPMIDVGGILFVGDCNS